MKNFLLLCAAALLVSLFNGSTAPLQAQQNCDPAYPTVCIPPPPPDLDCQDISYRSFPVRRRSDPNQPDPHRFDGDNDGIGCEPPPSPDR